MTNKEFKTEVQQLLDLVINSLYSNKEIFLRELISNASDAIDRARFESLSNESIKEPEGGWKIKVAVDKEAGTLRLSDNGVGMTAEEIDANIGTIASSGTKAFMKQLSESNAKDNPELIGQFGVGFYSAFMVSSQVELITKRAGSDETAQRWVSSGDGTYTIEDAEKENFGTEIILTLKEDEEEFLEEWKLRQIIKKYSDYVAFPVAMDITRSEAPTDDKGEVIEGADMIETVEEQTLNSMKAIWTRAPKDIKEEEHNEFYKAISHDFTDPAKIIHYNAEGTLEFNALLYVPAKAPMDLFYNMDPQGMHLYVKRVFIMSDCKELLPPYLRFMKGVVDSSDLPLNVSREILQEDKLLQKIQKNLTSKVLGALKEMKNKEREKYEDFFTELGKVLKEGVHVDFANKDKLADLLLFTTSKSDGKYVSLEEYAARMPEDQENIYFLSGENAAAVLNSPHLEAFKAKDIEVIFMTDPIDEWVVQSVTTHSEKELKAIDRGDIDLASEDEKAEKEEAKKEFDEKYTDLLEAMKSQLDDQVEDVRLSDRLTDSACCLVASDMGLNANTERIMKSMGQDVSAGMRILELNPSHPVIEKINSIKDSDEQFSDYCDLLVGQAMLTEGNSPKNPLLFTQLVSKLMAQ